MPGFLVHPVSSRLGGRATPGATQVVEQHPADLSMLVIELCPSAFKAKVSVLRCRVAYN